MTIAWISPKDPDEVLDYIVNWTARMDEGDTILTSNWTLPAGIIMNSNSFTNTATIRKTTIWLSGGTAGQSYLLLNRITTADGRTLDQTLKLKVKVK